MDKIYENTGIENLPSEVLNLIFEFLDWYSLQNISKVCNRFYKLVFQSKKLQSKLFMDVYANNIIEMAHQSEKLPYKNISITSKSIGGQNLARFVLNGRGVESTSKYYETVDNILNDHKNHIEKLKIANFSGYFVKEIFQYFTSLTELCLLEIYLTPSDEYPVNTLSSFDNSVNLSNLKLLEIKISEEILNYFRAENLEKIIIHGYSESYNLFLKYSTKLESLVLVDLKMHNFVKSNALNLGLKKLQLKFLNNRTRNLYMPCIVDYHNPNNEKPSKIDHLEELSIEFGDDQDQSDQNFILIEIFLSEIKTLKKFSFKINEKSAKFEKICLNDSIKEFEVHGNLDSVSLMSLISSCPSATSLTLNIGRYLKDSGILSHISTSMPNLKFLQINSFFNQVSSQTIFENVEKLKIRKLFYNFEEVWHKIALACPNLKQLSLNDKNIEIFPQNVENVLERCSKLEVLSFNADGKIRIFRGFFDAFVNKPGRIRRINFSVKYPDDALVKGIELLTKETKIQIYCKRN